MARWFGAILIALAGAGMMVFLLRYIDLNVQDVPWGRLSVWLPIGIVVTLCLIGGIALLSKGHKQSDRPEPLDQADRRY